MEPPSPIGTDSMTAGQSDDPLPDNFFTNHTETCSSSVADAIGGLAVSICAIN